MTFAWMGGNAIWGLEFGIWDLRFNSEMDANVSNLSPVIHLIFNSSLIRPAPLSLLTALYTPLPLKREELKIKGMSGERLETFASISELNLKSQNPSPKSQIALPPIQAKVIAYLSENGETALKILRKKLGNIG